MESSTHTIDRLFWKIALKDDEQAFRDLFFQFFSPLCVFAHRYLDDWSVCEDVVQETFFKIWKNRKNLEVTVSARNFLITAVRNQCIDFLRKRETELNWQQRLLESQSEPYSNPDLYSTVELEKLLAEALNKLPENVRIVFEMNRFEGKTYQEIATKQNISVKTVEAYMTRSLKFLRIELKDYLPLLLLLLDN